MDTSEPPPEAPSNEVTITKSGQTSMIGHEPGFVGVWDKNKPGPPIATFPLTDEGWSNAWLLYSTREDASRGMTRPTRVGLAVIVLVVMLAVVGAAFVDPYLNIPVISPFACSVKHDYWYGGGLLGPAGCYANPFSISTTGEASIASPASSLPAVPDRVVYRCEFCFATGDPPGWPAYEDLGLTVFDFPLTVAGGPSNPRLVCGPLTDNRCAISRQIPATSQAPSYWNAHYTADGSFLYAGTAEGLMTTRTYCQRTAGIWEPRPWWVMGDVGLCYYAD